MLKGSEVKLRSPIVVVLGHVDHGKCLLPEELVLLADGKLKPIRELFSKTSALRSGVYEVENADFNVYSLRRSNHSSLDYVKATQAWRVKYSGPIYEVLLEDGGKVAVTPEHPFLTSYGWFPAEQLSRGDEVYVINSLPEPINSKKTLETLINDEDFLRLVSSSAGDKLAAFRKFSEALICKAFKYSTNINAFNAWFNEEFKEKQVREGLKNLLQKYRNPEDLIFSLPTEYVKVFAETMIKHLGIKNSSREVKFLFRNYYDAIKYKILFSRVGFKTRVDLNLSEYYLTITQPSDYASHTSLSQNYLKQAKITDIRILHYDGYVYDLSVPGSQSFIANGIIVHNTTLLDKIRGTTVVSKEPGEMTQHVGASLVPLSVIEKLTEPLKQLFPIKLSIPGLLFIDTPGHEAFSNLRRRGGSAADFAILVIDVIEGVEKQTIESLEILLSRRVPFIIAANKIDKIRGWKPTPNAPFTLSIKNQSPQTIEELERRIYNIVGQLSNLKIPAERFDRIKDFRKAIAVVPVSAKTGEGIPELLAVLAGIIQKYLTSKIAFTSGPAKGVVLEVKELPGIGHVIDAIIYDGVLKEGDTIVVGGLEGPLITKVRALLMPKPLEEIRVVSESAFMSVNEVVAAAGVRIIAPNLKQAVAGAPLYVVKDESKINEYIKKVSEELTQVRFTKDVKGVVVKADTLGTLEAVVSMLEKRNIPIRIADVGPLTRREVIEASIVAKEDKYLGVILLFNVKAPADVEELARAEGVKIFYDNVIYRLIESYEKWVNEEKSKEMLRKLQETTFPAKFQVLPGYVFRRSNPAIVGVRVLGGVIRPGYKIMRSDGRPLGRIYQIQLKGKALNEARAGSEVAISIEGDVLVGRHFDEGDILYTDPSEDEINRILTEFPSEVSKEVLDLIKEIIKIKQQYIDRKFGLSVIFKVRDFEQKLQSTSKE